MHYVLFVRRALKTPLGYFLWEMLDVKKDEVSFAINWWYCPPARKEDLEALEMAEKLLADSTKWHKEDDRQCGNDSTNICIKRVQR